MDFSSVFVIINLQTWVLLLDFLGIGIPTPPPSRPDTPVEERPFIEDDHTPPPRGSDPPEKGSKKRTDLDDSFLRDAQDMLSLGDDSEIEDTLYMSTHNNNNMMPGPSPQDGRGATPTEHDSSAIPKARVLSDLSDMQEAYSHSVLSGGGALDDGGAGSSVWGVEGKLSVQIQLNVNALTVTFNKPEHPLARGSVRGVTAEVKLTRGNMEISGSLGQGSVLDMTETGAYYRERYSMYMHVYVHVHTYMWTCMWTCM